MYRTRRALPALLGAIGALAFAAPAAHAASQTLTFDGIGTVTAVEDGAADNDVTFTVTPLGATPVGNLRLFVDTFDNDMSYLAVDSSRVVVTPLFATSRAAIRNEDGTIAAPGCQVYAGNASELATVTSVGGSLQFTIPKDYMRPQPRLLLVDTSTASGCIGQDGASQGLTGQFDENMQFDTPWPWALPSAPVGLTATPGPGSITLSWTPTGDTNGVHYQVVEVGVDRPVAENVTATSFTVDGLAPGVGHSYQVRAFRFWDGGPDGRSFSAFTSAASAIAGAFPAPRTGQNVRGASAKSAGKGASARRLAAPKGLRARASRARVTLTLPKVPKGSKLQILRATGKKGGKFARKVTTSKRSWTDRKVKRGTTYRYRIVRVTAGGQLSLPSQTVTVRVPRR